MPVHRERGSGVRGGDWKCLPGQGPQALHQRAMFQISPSMEYLEQAFDDLKYGRPSQKPFIDGNIASTMDDSLVPRGKHVLSLVCAVRPLSPEGGNLARDPGESG